jgi:hypothetical protein
MRKFLTSIFEKLAEKLKEKEPSTSVFDEEKGDHESQPKAKNISKKRKQKEAKNKGAADLPQELLPLISPQKMKLISIAGDIRLDPDKTESAFMARQLVQATLPHKNPGDVPVWSRTNGNLTLSIQPGMDTKKKKSIGYPYGTLPRLLLFWITTEAVRTNNPHIELGKSLSNFMEKLGLDSSRGGKRSDVRRLREQMIRLFQSTISFDQSNNGKKAWLNMQIAPKGVLWWDEKNPEQNALWGSWIQLGDDFFKAVTSSPVPIDVRALKALKNSPLALDLYAWATYTAYQTQQRGKERSISWELMHEQFGAEYSSIKEFSRNASKALLKVQVVYPTLNIKRVRGGIKVLPSKPAITIKSRKDKESST